MAVPAMRDSLHLTYIASANLAAYTRVKIDTNGELAAAGLTEIAIGYLTERGATAGEPTSVRHQRAPEQIGRAHAAIAVGGTIFSAAAGRVDDADGGSAVVLGYALTAATNQDDLVRFVTVD